jgi:serine-type D-Ala-D-Ala carboxypeptidase (penicillin-binding protein 5/6)
MKIIYSLLSILLILFSSSTTFAGRASIQDVSAAPYRSAILLNATTGEVLFEKNADATIYPASSLKLMVLLVILERIEQGYLQLDDMVQVTVEAYKMGGSQVYLDPKEQFSIEDLLYALMIQSANDAAVALATHVAGSKEGFVKLMNQKAQELGMKKTTFYSVHGLPPSTGQGVDVSSARDFGILCHYMSTKPEMFKYTSAKVRDFRGGEFIMRTHNHLLKQVDGCDGFKTGYFLKAGFSIAATAKRGGVRIIAIVMGSKNRKVRDAKAIELINKGFVMVPSQPEDATIVIPDKTLSVIDSQDNTQTPKQPPSATSITSDKETKNKPNNGWGKFFAGLVLGFLLYAALDYLITKKQKKRKWRIK